MPFFFLRVSFFCVAPQLVPFFFTTWEHYYTDELVLPIVNGPSEGVRRRYDTFVASVLGTGTLVFVSVLPLRCRCYVCCVGVTYVGLALRCLSFS